MIPRASRYLQTDVYSSNAPDRTDYPIDGVRPHQTQDLTARREHRVLGHERLDTLAERYYDDPTLFWVICDANETIFPDDLMVPGRVLRIPRNNR